MAKKKPAGTPEDEAQPTKSLLPKQHPKRTGRRGIRPVEDPQKQLEELDKPVPKGSLLAKQPPKPTIIGDRMSVFYLDMKVKKIKGNPTLAMRFTIPLEDGHAALLPKIIADSYKDVKKKGRAGMTLKDIPDQHAEIFLSSDIKETILELEHAQMIKAALAIVERKGEGAVRSVIRLSFWLRVKLAADVSTFAERNLENTFWMRLGEAQQQLFDKEE